MAETAPPACVKCRTHRVKCDKTLPICGRCRRLGHVCEYPFRNSAAAYLNYASNLEEEIAQLEVELETLKGMQRNAIQTAPSANSPLSMRSEPRIPTTSTSNDSQRYLGPSSGMMFIEASIHLAQANGLLDAPEDTPAPKQHPVIPAALLDGLEQPHQNLTIPPRDNMRELFHAFSLSQWQYRILEQEEFDALLDRYYQFGESSDAAAAAVHLVFAIALHLSGNSGSNVVTSSLAEAHHEKAIGMLDSLIRDKTLESLQVILLLLLFSMVNPQKPIVWQLLGIASRMASSLKLHSEDGAKLAAARFGVSEDLPRRLFWSLYSMDRAVGNTLGRPAFLLDQIITCALPGAASAHLSLPVRLANHCFRLRRLQSEAADVLYQQTVDYPENYVPDFQVRLDQWFQDIPVESSDHVLEWFHHSYYNLCMFAHRPSPANPQPGSEDLHRCFDAASRVIQSYTKLDERESIDTTWMAVHWLFLAAVTQLFCLWTDDNIRRETDWASVYDDIQSCIMILSAMTERWKSGRKMLRLYRRLSKGTVAKYAQITQREAPSQVTDVDMTIADMFGINGVMQDSDARFWFDMEAMDFSSF